MKHDPETHHRRSIRLKDYDYSQEGAYFVTICTHERRCLFGEIDGGEMRLNGIGKVVRAEWLRSAEIRREIYLDAFVVMPNHLHGIVFLMSNMQQAFVGATGGRPSVPAKRERIFVLENQGDCQSPLHPRGPAYRSLAAFIGGFKSACTGLINELRCTPQILVWQRNYYEHVIRGDKSLDAIRNYIEANPAQWANDPDNPDLSREEMSYSRQGRPLWVPSSHGLGHPQGAPLRR